MSCDAVAFSAMLWMASFNPGQAAGPAPAVLEQPAAPPSVAGEPLFRDIVKRATQLRTWVDSYRAAADSPPPTAPPRTFKDFDRFSKQIGELAALDMKGHLTLKERGATDDLKCILRGISQDLPEKLTAMSTAKTAKEQDLALRDMSYLLNDNVEVITAPPQPAA